MKSINPPMSNMLNNVNNGKAETQYRTEVNIIGGSSMERIQEVVFGIRKWIFPKVAIVSIVKCRK